MPRDDENRSHQQEHSPYLVTVSDSTRKDARHQSPSVARNTQPILETLAGRLPETGLVLELASGTGEHAMALGRTFPKLTFQPSDPTSDARASISAWRATLKLPNVLPPLNLDATHPDWEASINFPVSAMLVCNLLHISPWAATQGLLRGAGRLLSPNSKLFIYGCFSKAGKHLSTSNEQFHESLIRRNPAWGVRSVEEVEKEGNQHGLEISDIIPMPANNLMLSFSRP